MTSTCPNCNQTVLPADTICWHCGYQLLPHSTKRTESPAEIETSVTPVEPFSLSAVIVYSAVTAILIIAFLVSMRILGQHPLVLLNPNTNVNTGWQPITDQAVRFTLDIPPTWQAFDRDNLQQQEAFMALLASDEPLRTAVTPLSDAVSDIEIVMIATANRTEPRNQSTGFVIVAHSEEMSHLSLDQTIALIQQPNTAVTINEIIVFSSFIGDTRAAVELELPQTPDHLTCEQHLVYSNTDAYIVIGCTPQARFAINEETLTKILGSFQTLR